MKTAVTPAQFWAQMFAEVRPSWWADADRIIAEAEPRRTRAKFNTGSISRTAAVALRAISQWADPIVAVEVGTFIGVSTLSLQAHTIYTCDISNDCFDSTDRIHTFPYQNSTTMLRSLVALPVKADLFFFDGLLSDTDAELVRLMSSPRTVYVFDDYNGEYKGVQNVRRLAPTRANHVLMPADGWVKDRTTLAVLVPEDRL